jgi:hypothetical protein
MFVMTPDSPGWAPSIVSAGKYGLLAAFLGGSGTTCRRRQATDRALDGSIGGRAQDLSSVLAPT